jgi:NAD(P)-dependent dehydrogenase (short-subunit alcohol dehydrogenase family)
LGEEAIQFLKSNGSNNCELMQLDISDEGSIRSFVESVKQRFESIDVLVNNAAIAFKNEDPTPFELQARPTLCTNYFGTFDLTIQLLPLLRKAKNFGRIVNVASEAGHLRIFKESTLKQTFANIEELSIEKLNGLLRKFVEDVENKVHQENGWPNTCYGTSKMAVIALTKRMALEEEKLYRGDASFRESNSPVIINCCCPGYCDTDMTSHKGTKTAEDGSRTPVMLALVKPTSADDFDVLFANHGKFFAGEKEITW